jgi:hypothetical protein
VAAKLALPSSSIPFIYPPYISCHNLSPLRLIVHSLYTGHTAFTPSRGYLLSPLSFKPNFLDLSNTNTFIALAHLYSNLQPGATNEPSKRNETFAEKHQPENMRYSIAAVLATLLAGQAVAVSLKHGHQHLHTKKEAQPSAMEVYVTKGSQSIPIPS